jgi:hypothetical protein
MKKYQPAKFNMGYIVNTKWFRINVSVDIGRFSLGAIFSIDDGYVSEDRGPQGEVWHKGATVILLATFVTIRAVAIWPEGKLIAPLPADMDEKNSVPEISPQK